MKPQTKPILENHEKFNDLLVLEPQELQVEESRHDILPTHMEDQDLEENHEHSRINERELHVFTESDEEKSRQQDDIKVCIRVIFCLY